MTKSTGFYFYPRPPRGGRHAATGPRTSYDGFLSTPSARRATAILQEKRRIMQISIHALREEGDRCRRERRGAGREISIHALREEGDPCRPSRTCRKSDFYPRPPRGGRPGALGNLLSTALDFYPRPPRGGRHTSFLFIFVKMIISIHALREEGNLASFNASHKTNIFLSTPSARRATKFDESTGLFENISIHALREEGDGRSSTRICSNTLFLSTPSARRATCNSARVSGASVFLSTPSARRATQEGRT